MEQRTETNEQKDVPETTKRKPYHKPEVIPYGNIREITQNVGPKGNLDGGGGAGAGPKTGV